MSNLPKLAAATLIAGLASLDTPVSRQAVAEEIMNSPTESKQADHPYVGMWVTGDGRIRQELLPNGRYDEARGNRKSAYQGRYVVTGNHIDYWDDTGFTADGAFIDGVLHHGGMVFYRER
ncbi:Atu4866 domain-containing protein [Ensifer adhaerens]|uniref:Atu4866 domain-containing protein n=1 Tax=Ensifer adhaerens TaxID=106592 RepID=UPI0009900A7C|nr:Atu4866 domain-containing protein [Ensifer adhaerens]